MVNQFLILFFIAPFVSQHVFAKTDETTGANFQAESNSTLKSPKETSYFYQDPKGYGTYEFGYHIEDKDTENIQFRKEKRYLNGTVVGSYGYLRPDGKMEVVHYVADQNGYRAEKNLTDYTPFSPVTTPPTLSTTGIPTLNLSAGTLPPQLVNEVMDKFQIDLSPDASPGDILHPNISAIINGEVELKTNKNTSQLGFDVVRNFIPSHFPFAPFQLPNELPNAPANG